jgi:stage V sporulation protein S
MAFSVLLSLFFCLIFSIITASYPIIEAYSISRRHTPVEVLKVSSTSKPNAVAGAIAGVMRERGHAEVQAIGAGALNQAIKAVAIARGFVAPNGIDMICIPAFTDIEINGEERTAMKLILQKR